MSKTNYITPGLMTSSTEQLAVMRPAYMSLPSPNITCGEESKTGGCQEVGQPWPGWSPPGPESQEVEEEGGEVADVGDGAVGGMALERRGALVPQRSGRESSCSRQEDITTSVAVIPPMQICPGDLLVYSRVLAHKASGYGESGL